MGTVYLNGRETNKLAVKLFHASSITEVKDIIEQLPKVCRCNAARNIARRLNDDVAAAAGSDSPFAGLKLVSECRKMGALLHRVVRDYKLATSNEIPSNDLLVDLVGIVEQEMSSDHTDR